MAYAGLDVGTSGTKMVVYDLEGNVLYKAAERYKEYGGDGYREIDGNEILEHVFKVLKNVGENCPVPIDAMAVTSLGESVVFLNDNKESLCRSMVTGDKRGILETEQLTHELGAKYILDITGLPPCELYGLPKYMWVNSNSNVVKDASVICFYEDFIGYVLTGKRRVSYSSAARSMAFDIHNRCWSKELLNYAEIDVSKLSEPCDAGTVIGTILPEMAKKLHLNPEMKVVVGGHDQSCAALGSGLNDMEVGECGMGTCEFMFMRLPEAKSDMLMIDSDLTCVPYVLPEAYLTSLEVTTCGILKNWCMETVLKSFKQECELNGKDVFEEVDKLIDGKETDVMVLPQFGSSGNPDINHNVTGTICGLRIDTKPEEIYQAILEGMAFQFMLGYEQSQKLGASIKKLICTGGGSKSEVTMQMRADIMNVEVSTITTEESGTLGCMILAATGTGAYGSVEEAIERAVHIKKTFKPNPSRQAYYMNKYKRFKKLYELMHLF